MSGGGPRSKSAERVAMKYRRVSLDPYGTYQPPHQHQHYGQPQPGQKVRSVSLATAEAGDIHVYNNNPQLYR